MTRYGDEATCDECGNTIVAEDSDLDEHGWFWGGVELDKHMNYHRCNECGPVMVEEHVKVKVGYGIDPDGLVTHEDLDGNWDKDLLASHGVTFESNVESLIWEFEIPKSKVKSFYFMLQFLAGLDMPTCGTHIDMGMFVDGERYDGGN
jgi:hypothetical protein